jgi:hypothetical protein
MQLHADWAITLACGATWPYVPTTVEDWDIPDPVGKSLEEVRAIRDATRADRTAHHVRLEHLLPGLAQEFEGVRSAAEIRTCADAILAQYDDVPIRSHVMTIANRQTRDCLRAEHCDALAVT